MTYKKSGVSVVECLERANLLLSISLTLKGLLGESSVTNQRVGLAMCKSRDSGLDELDKAFELLDAGSSAEK